MGQVTYRSLYQYVIQEIEKRSSFSNTSIYKDQLNRTSVSPVVDVSRYDVSTAELVRAIQDTLADSLPPRIISGLTVSATSPISSSVNVDPGKGTVGGNLYELSSVSTIVIPFNDTTSIFYITLYEDNLLVEQTYSDYKLTIAKIVVPKPGTTIYVQDTKDDSSWNAYIVNFKKFDLYGDANNKFEEDTIELLRDNISPILADNLIGNIRLNEDLKIINTQGTLELNSKELLLKDTNDTTLAKFNRIGTFFYDENGIEIAKFTTDEARVGNIVVLKNAIQSGDFSSGVSGFRIKDDGDAEFYNVLVRGKMSTMTFEKDTISTVGGNLLVMDGDVLDEDMTALDNSPLIIIGDTTFSVGDILRIKDGTDDEWLEVTAVNSNTYTVTRDKDAQYATNNNPSWKKGVSVTNYGQSGDGGIFLTSSLVNSPYVTILTHTGSPWNSTTTHLRMGNLNGFLGYNTNLYGIAIGNSNSYLKYDPTNNLQIKGSVTITGGNAAVTYYQTIEPGSSSDPNTPKDGDYWIDTDDDNKLYTYQSGAWVEITSGGGLTTFRQSSASGGAGIPVALNAGDLWIDTGDNDKLYRATNQGDDQITAGEWELQDGAKATGWSYNGDTTKIDGGNLWVGSSIVLAGNGYIRSGQTAYDTGTGWWIGDVSDTPKMSIGNSSGTNKVTWDGSTLTVRGSLNADDIIAGTLSADRIAATSITAAKLNVSTLSAITADLGTITAGTVTGATLQTASSGSRVVLNTSNLVAYDDATNEIFKILISGTDVGDVIIGDYANTKGIKWDKSAGTFNIKGAITATSGDFTGTVNVGTAGKVYIDGANEVIKVYDASNNLRVELGKLS